MTGAPAVLTISRDRRGYEHFYLVQPASHRRGKGPARILYWFRTPPGIKVGRPPFDEEMRRRIEAQPRDGRSLLSPEPAWPDIPATMGRLAGRS